MSLNLQQDDCNLTRSIVSIGHLVISVVIESESTSPTARTSDIITPWAQKISDLMSRKDTTPKRM